MRPAKQLKADQDAPEFLATLPEGLAAALVATLEGESFRVVRAWQGGTARCSLLVFPGSSKRLVLKHSTHEPGVEYEADLYARAAQTKAAGVFPTVHAVFPEHSALLMEYAPGRGVRAAMQRGWSPRDAAISIYQALDAYYEEFEVPYSDFHPANVVLSRDRATLVDPAPPGWHKAELGEPPLVTDLALWTYSTIGNLPWDVLRSPMGAVRLLKLNVELIALCLANQTLPETARPKDVRKRTNRYFSCLWKEWPRDKVVALFGWPTATGLVWLAGRRLRTVR